MPGCANPRDPRRRTCGREANPLTPYEPSVAVRTRSVTAWRVTKDRPGFDSVDTQGSPPGGDGIGVVEAGEPGAGGFFPPPFRPSRAVDPPPHPSPGPPPAPP